jgi:lipoate-protein ligase A
MVGNVLAHAVLLSHPLPDPLLNLAQDTSLFHALESAAGPEALLVWESPARVVVLGRSGVVSRDVEADACAADGVAIVRRDSGGGAVVLGPGCLNYSLVLSLERRPQLRDVRASYRQILGWLVRSLAVPGLEIRGGSDLAIAGRKVSGNAQRRGARALLHHGTLLYAFDARAAERYLKEPARRPDYRRDRGHAEFLGNLPLSSRQIRDCLYGRTPIANRCLPPRM